MSTLHEQSGLKLESVLWVGDGGERAVGKGGPICFMYVKPIYTHTPAFLALSFAFLLSSPQLVAAFHHLFLVSENNRQIETRLQTYCYGSGGGGFSPAS